MDASPASNSTVSSSSMEEQETGCINLVPSPTFDLEPEASSIGNRVRKRRVIHVSSDEERDTQVEEYAPSEHDTSVSDMEFDQTIKEASARARARSKAASKAHKMRSNLTRQTSLNKRQKVKTTIVVSASKLQQPQDPFQHVQPKLAPGCKSAFDVLGGNEKSSTNPSADVAEQSSKAAYKPNKPKRAAKRTGQAGLRSSAWQWFSVKELDGVRYGVCVIETVEGKPCDEKVRTGDSTTALWRHLKVRHGFSGDGTPSVSLVCLLTRSTIGSLQSNDNTYMNFLER